MVWELKSVVSVDEDEFIDETLVTMALIPRKISLLYLLIILPCTYCAMFVMKLLVDMTTCTSYLQ
jgi:hypothetical protein